MECAVVGNLIAGADTSVFSAPRNAPAACMRARVGGCVRACVRVTRGVTALRLASGGRTVPLDWPVDSGQRLTTAVTDLPAD